MKRLPTQEPPAPTSPVADPFATLAGKVPQDPVVGGVRVVVKNPDGSPARDAIVVFTPWRGRAADAVAQQAASLAFPVDEPRGFAMQAAVGTRFRVDERGATRVPESGHVLAFVGELFAREVVRELEPEPRLVLQLAPPCIYAVEVVTAAGGPAVGVLVGLEESPRLGFVPLCPTGADGAMAVRLASHREQGTVALLGVVAKTLLVAPLPLPGGRLRMKLPETTAIAATFAGDLAPGSALRWSLQCGDTDGGSESRKRSSAAASDRPVPGEVTGDRSARWPFVEVGMVVSATVQSDSLELARATGTSEPASEPLALARVIAAPTFALQIQDVDGTPAGDRPVGLEWIFGGDTRGGGARTNREGWVEVVMPSQFSDRGDGELRVHLYGASSGDLHRGLGKVAVKANGNTRIELAPLRCEPEALVDLVAGRVVTADGKPVPYLKIQVDSREAYTDGEGRFATRVENDRRPVSIGLSRTWCFVEGQPWEAEVPAGTDDARLVVQRAARVRFHSDSKGRLSVFHYFLEPAIGDGPAVPLPFSLGQSVLCIPPGHWDFVVRGGSPIPDEGNSVELHRLPDLRGESGVETHDPRFMAFDWRAYAVPVDITVRDAAGQPINGCMVSVAMEAGSYYMATYSANGVVRMLVPKDGGHVEVEPKDDEQPKIVLGKVRENQVVVLTDGVLPLTVTLQPMPQVPSGVEVMLSIDDRYGVPFDARGVATLMVAKAGTFTPAIRVRNGNTVTGPLLWSLPAIEVLGEGKKTVIELTPTQQQELAALLR